MDKAPRTQLNAEDDEDRAKPQVAGLKEITCPDLVRILGKKGRPRLSALPWWLESSHLLHVFADGTLSEMITYAVHPGCT
jgi:hypothetical protein